MVDVVAHRGASADRAEHTLAAYRRAVEVGADALECDVRLTADGVPGLRARPPGRPHVERPRPRLGAGAGRPRRARLRARGSSPGPTRTTQPRPRPRGRPGADPGRAAGVRPRLRPAGRAGDRDQAPDPLRRAWSSAGWSRCSTASAGRTRGVGDRLPVRVMSFSWLSLRRMRALAPEHPAVLADGARARCGCGTGRCPAHVGSPGRASRSCAAHPKYVGEVHRSRRRGARLDRRRARGRRPVPAAGRRRDHHQPAGRGAGARAVQPSTSTRTDAVRPDSVTRVGSVCRPHTT